MASTLERLLELPETLARSATLLRRMAANRAELFSLELREETGFAARLFTALALGVFCAALFLLLATWTIILLLPDEYKLAGLIIFTLLYGLAALLLIGLGLRRLRKRPKPFCCSIELLKKDGECSGDD
jgi:uncharacterized membrane protein YqjE